MGLSSIRCQEQGNARLQLVRNVLTCVLLGLMLATTARAQNGNGEIQGIVKDTSEAAVVGAAVKMPEENYSFKPTPDVRSFGQLVGHVADASYMFCSQAIGETVAPKNIEKTKTTKADLVAAIKDATAYCTKSFDSMTDAKGSQMIKMFNFDLARLTVYSINTAHTDEHYGNMVTYMRLKGIVPPTSENAPAPPAK